MREEGARAVKGLLKTSASVSKHDATGIGIDSPRFQLEPSWVRGPVDCIHHQHAEFERSGCC